MLNLSSIVVANLKMETGINFSMSGINSGLWNRTMLNLCGIVVAILKMATGRNFSISIVVAILKMATGRNFSVSGINSGHHNLPTYEMALKSNNWICAVLWWPFWKWRSVEIFQCRELFRDIIIYPHIKYWWYRKMLNFYSPYFMPCFGSHFENFENAELLLK